MSKKSSDFCPLAISLQMLTDPHPHKTPKYNIVRSSPWRPSQINIPSERTRNSGRRNPYPTIESRRIGHSGISSYGDPATLTETQYMVMDLLFIPFTIRPSEAILAPALDV
jgi:hypothetical protein